MNKTERLVAISVIVPHFNDLAGLDKCLTALVNQQGGMNIEIVVADNNSIAGIEEVGKTVAGRARLVSVLEKGAGPARNGGVAVAKGAILAFTDSDCVPSSDWLYEGVAMLGKFDIVGGHVSVITSTGKITGAEGFELVFAFNFARYIELKGFCGAGNMFVRRNVFDIVGGFRKDVSEDVDWCHRATKLGYSLGYAHRANVGHPARITWRELITKWKRLHMEMFLLDASTKPGRARWIAKTLLMPISAVAHTPRVLFSDRLSTRRDRFITLKTLYRIRLWRFVDGITLFLYGKRSEPQLRDTIAWYLQNQ